MVKANSRKKSHRRPASSACDKGQAKGLNCSDPDFDVDNPPTTFPQENEHPDSPYPYTGVDPAVHAMKPGFTLMWVWTGACRSDGALDGFDTGCENNVDCCEATSAWACRESDGSTTCPSTVRCAETAKDLAIAACPTTTDAQGTHAGTVSCCKDGTWACDVDGVSQCPVGEILPTASGCAVDDIPTDCGVGIGATCCANGDWVCNDSATNAPTCPTIAADDSVCPTLISCGELEPGAQLGYRYATEKEFETEFPGCDAFLRPNGEIHHAADAFTTEDAGAFRPIDAAAYAACLEGKISSDPMVSLNKSIMVNSATCESDENCPKVNPKEANGNTASDWNTFYVLGVNDDEVLAALEEYAKDLPEAKSFCRTLDSGDSNYCDPDTNRKVTVCRTKSDGKGKAQEFCMLSGNVDKAFADQEEYDSFRAARDESIANCVCAKKKCTAAEEEKCIKDASLHEVPAPQFLYTCGPCS